MAQSRVDGLTVDSQWKVDREISEKLNSESRPSSIVPVAKWAVTLLTSLLITCIFVATKLSFMSLSKLLEAKKPQHDVFDHHQWTQYTGQFIIVYLVIAVPYFLILLRACWNGLTARTGRWPKKTAILSCLAAGVLEPLGIVLLALKVLPNLNPALGALTISSCILTSVLGATIDSFVHRARTVWKIVNIGGSSLVVGGAALTFYLIVRTSGASVDLWHVAVCVASLNVAWLPWLQKSMVMPRCDTPAGPTRDPEAIRSTIPPPPVHLQRFPGEGDHTSLTLFNASTTWKSTFILYATKTVSTFLFSFIFFYIDGDYPINLTQEMHSVFTSAWDLESSIDNWQTLAGFGVNLIGGLVGYTLVVITCHTNMQRGCLGVPLLLSLPLTTLIVCVDEFCYDFLDYREFYARANEQLPLVIIAAVAFTLGQGLSTGRYAFKKEKLFLLKERELFWIPGYNGAALDMWLMLNRKQSIQAGRVVRWPGFRSVKTRVYICTTMYREDEGEMKQLLRSLAKVNEEQQKGETFFESHIFFDGGVLNSKLSEFALNLVSLLEETLEVKPGNCTKVAMPYGVRLSWGLPVHSDRTKEQMTFNIHLKDNNLVKNKKRWSQVMYMSYVLDFLGYSDADVKFTPDSVEALLDLMSRDSSIGAVCARTHPMGSGPLVWYQVFEYAIGHWFQKAAEHVLGSVLCAPGCFSVYRCRALKDILPKYSKKVETAFDFLTKDMGEDRWLCTLMVQSGWRIEYCAASENSTNCPSEFDEFYKQRRRWVASTLANMMLIIKEWDYISLFNQRLTPVFLLYQGLLLFSTLIGPSTVILVVAGGLEFAWDFSATAGLILQVILCIGFSIVCLTARGDTQLLIAKLYTFLYAVVMCAVAVGTAEQIVIDLSEHDHDNFPPQNVTQVITTTKRPNHHISLYIPASVPTIYLAFLVGMFLLGGLLHPREFTCLLHGIWYLLCLPSAYLVLIIYSICNLTDSSWGTREAASTSVMASSFSWKKTLTRIYNKLFFCCRVDTKEKAESVSVGVQTQSSGLRQSSQFDDTSVPYQSGEYLDIQDTGGLQDDLQNDDLGFDTTDAWSRDVPIPVEQWLTPEFPRQYVETFKSHGFENTLFIKGLTEVEVIKMGIQRRGHVQSIMADIAELPAFDLEYKVPNNVNEWLDEIGLSMYKENFRRNRIETLKQMEILKGFDSKAIEKDLKIKKYGHIKRLLYAIRMLRDPTEGQKKSLEIRQIIERVPLNEIQMINIEEFEFWTKLRTKCLEPDLKAFGIEAEIKAKLVSLRNNWLIILAVANTLWLILISTIAMKANLTVIGANPLGVVFLFIFGLLFLIQFLAMVIHRMSTLCHYIARAPYTCGQPLQKSWSFKDRFDELQEIGQAERLTYSVNRRHESQSNERTPLLSSANRDSE